MDWLVVGLPKRLTPASEGNKTLILELISNGIYLFRRYTFEVAPIFTLMEDEVIQMFCKKFGFISGDGIFSPGGSMSNMYVSIDDDLMASL